MNPSGIHGIAVNCNHEEAPGAVPAMGRPHRGHCCKAGRRRLLSTAIYAKTDVPALRTLARPWPAGGGS